MDLVLTDFLLSHRLAQKVCWLVHVAIEFFC